MTIIQKSAILLLLAASAQGFSSPASSFRQPVSLPASTVVEDTIIEQTEVAPAAKSWDDDGFVFGMEGSGLERPKGKVAQVVVEGDTLESTNKQRAIVWSTLVGHASLVAFSTMGMLEVNRQAMGALGDNDALAVGITGMEALLVAMSSWYAADFGSGVLHWSVDNYGNGKTPIMGGIIAAFQGHHSAPWTILERGFENNVVKLCIPFGVQTVLAMKFVFGLGPFATLFWTIFCFMEIMSQEFHKMSHATKTEAGPIWNALQDRQLTIDRKFHAQHHIAPYDGNYCIVTGRCNKFLDESGFFRRLEHAVYNLNGVESNAWKIDPKLRERTLSGDYTLPRSKR
jgi:hypothetical protein